ncbi:MAG: hypothetical protein HOH50_06530 [Planctomycetaceae bacterium]|nr:hypothetical protein [Planctomycetaceae bacterium]
MRINYHLCPTNIAIGKIYVAITNPQCVSGSSQSHQPGKYNSSKTFQVILAVKQILSFIKRDVMDTGLVGFFISLHAISEHISFNESFRHSPPK